MSANPRQRTVAVSVGSVKVGGGNPIVVQSMTNTDTADVQSTVNQVMALANAGSELVRVTVNTERAAAAVPTHRRDARQVRRPRADHRRFPLQRAPAAQEVSRHGARALAKYRINPGTSTSARSTTTISA
jgi:(E)-4-hydroxy-3-methylbut-2-enyl-diphosphate synthase